MHCTRVVVVQVGAKRKCHHGLYFSSSFAKRSGLQRVGCACSDLDPTSVRWGSSVSLDFVECSFGFDIAAAAEA